MIDVSEPPQYSTGHTLLAMLLVLSPLFPSMVGAQNCDDAKDRIYQITETDVQQVPDSLQMLLDLATFVRICEGNISTELELWLLNNEVFALDKLQQYEEVAIRVDHFFDTYFADASDPYRARFYVWRTHLSALKGADLAMVRDYAEAQRYIYALDEVDRATLYFNGAHAYIGIGEYETALGLTQQGLALISVPETFEERMVTARGLLLGAESGLRLGTGLEQVKEKLDRATELFSTLGDTSRAAIATSLLGMTYAAEGDTSRALATMAAATRWAQASGGFRSQIYTLWRQGEFLRQVGDLNAAKPILLRAFEAAEIHREFYLIVAYQLAMLYEQQHELDRAIHFYRAVLDAPKQDSFAVALRAERTAHAAQIRLLLIENERDHQRYRYALVALLIVLTTIGFVFLLRLKSPPSLDKHASNGVYIPKNMPTGLTLEELERRFQKIVRSEKLGRRLAYLYAVLFDPELILAYIKDSYYAIQVEEDRVENNTALLLCAGTVEEARTGVAFTGKAENTLRSYLRGEFENRGWEWPKHPVLWKRYFLEFHVERLFQQLG